MRKIFLLLIMVMSCGWQLYAQKTNNFVYYDSLTYRLYKNKQYNLLLKAGNKALKNHIDYYYLRMRLGIAAYQQKKYRLAALHFKKALQYNNTTLVKEYLYFSALWGGEDLLAQKIKNQMSPAMLKRLQLSNNKILSVDVVLAYLRRNETLPENLSIPKEDGYQVFPREFYNASVSLKHELGKKAQMVHMFTYLYKTNEKYTYYDNQLFEDNSFNTNQIQYYVGTIFPVTESLSIRLSGHISLLAVPVYTERSGFMRQQYLVQSTDWHADGVFSTSVVKSWPYFSLQAELNVMGINSNFTFQPSGIFRFYPLANLNLYTESVFSYLIRNSKGIFFQQQKLGVKISSRLWAEGSYFSGNVSGFVLDNGSLLFNGLEEVKQMAGVKLILLPAKKTTFTLGYQYRQQSVYFMPANDLQRKTNRNDLNYSLFYILMSWSL